MPPPSRTDWAKKTLLLWRRHIHNMRGTFTPWVVQWYSDQLHFVPDNPQIQHMYCPLAILCFCWMGTVEGSGWIRCVPVYEAASSHPNLLHKLADEIPATVTTECLHNICDRLILQNLAEINDICVISFPNNLQILRMAVELVNFLRLLYSWTEKPRPPPPAGDRLCWCRGYFEL